MEKIINGLKEVINQTGLKIDDKTIFENAIKIYISKKNNENHKEEKVNKIQDKPTEKQLSFLVKNKYNGVMPSTKEEAKKIIHDFLGGSYDN